MLFFTYVIVGDLYGSGWTGSKVAQNYSTEYNWKIFMKILIQYSKSISIILGYKNNFHFNFIRMRNNNIISYCQHQSIIIKFNQNNAAEMLINDSFMLFIYISAHLNIIEWYLCMFVYFIQFMYIHWTYITFIN